MFARKTGDTNIQRLPVDPALNAAVGELVSLDAANNQLAAAAAGNFYAILREEVIAGVTTHARADVLDRADRMEADVISGGPATDAIEGQLVGYVVGGVDLAGGADFNAFFDGDEDTVTVQVPTQ
jgi:hypothetical protein